MVVLSHFSQYSALIIAKTRTKSKCKIPPWGTFFRVFPQVLKIQRNNQRGGVPLPAPGRKSAGFSKKPEGFPASGKPKQKNRPGVQARRDHAGACRTRFDRDRRRRAPVRPPAKKFPARSHPFRQLSLVSGPSLREDKPPRCHVRKQVDARSGTGSAQPGCPKGCRSAPCYENIQQGYAP